MTAAPNRLANLDGLRGVAAIAVMLFHGGHILGVQDFVPRGHLAVDFFFLLSGYIMGRTYQESLERGEVRRFLWRRFCRLWPLLVLGTAIGVPISIAIGHGDQLALNIALGLLCLPHLAVDPAAFLFPLNNAQWSLFYEVGANLSHAAARKLIRFAPLLGVMAISGAAMYVGGRRGFGFNGGFSNGTLWLGACRIAFSYSAGLLLHRLNLPAIRLPFGVPALVMFGVFLVPRAISPGLLDMVVIVALWPVLLVCAASDPIVRPRWSAALIALGGELSYPVYILHHPLLRLAQHLQPRLGLTPPALLAISAALIGVMSWTALVLYDRPVRRFLAARPGRRRVGGAARAVS